jgi:hypothetical protein
MMDNIQKHLSYITQYAARIFDPPPSPEDDSFDAIREVGDNRF